MEAVEDVEGGDGVEGEVQEGGGGGKGCFFVEGVGERVIRGEGREEGEGWGCVVGGGGVEVGPGWWVLEGCV